MWTRQISAGPPSTVPGTDVRTLVRPVDKYRSAVAAPYAQPSWRGSNINEIVAGLDRSTAWLGPARSVSKAARASRMIRLQRSANGIRS
jgi:hypothetical protein